MNSTVFNWEKTRYTCCTYAHSIPFTFIYLLQHRHSVCMRKCVHSHMMALSSPDLQLLTHSSSFSLAHIRHVIGCGVPRHTHGNCATQICLLLCPDDHTDTNADSNMHIHAHVQICIDTWHLAYWQDIGQRWSNPGETGRQITFIGILPPWASKDTQTGTCFCAVFPIKQWNWLLFLSFENQERLTVQTVIYLNSYSNTWLIHCVIILVNINGTQYNHRKLNASGDIKRKLWMTVMAVALVIK